MRPYAPHLKNRSNASVGINKLIHVISNGDKVRVTAHPRAGAPRSRHLRRSLIASRQRWSERNRSPPCDQALDIDATAPGHDDVTTEHDAAAAAFGSVCSRGWRTEPSVGDDVCGDVVGGTRAA